MSSRAAVWASLSAACGAGGCYLGWHHPVAPVGLVLMFAALVVAHARWPGLWLVLLPACLPWLNFSPWTGWLLVDEFDLLLLSVIAGGFARLAWPALWQKVQAERHATVRAGTDEPQADRNLSLVVGMLALSGVVGLTRGLLDGEPLRFGWFLGYADPLNALRVAKSMVFALCLLPLLRRTMARDQARAARDLLRGMTLGLACVACAALWERLAFPGLTDFSAAYRVTALFWEMHVGGGAIDAYLAMAAPFAVLCLVRARGVPMRLFALVLIVLVFYTCLTTFSRAVYVGVTVPIGLLALHTLFTRLRARLMRQKDAGRSHPCGHGPTAYWALLLVPAVLVWGAMGPDSFLANRLMATESVWSGRLKHWQNSIDLLQSPADWMLGIGTGRFPARYERGVARAGFAGSVQLGAKPASGGDAPSYVTLRGPVHGEGKGGLYALTQRVSIVPDATYEVGLDVRALLPSAIVLQVCERHLLYDWSCQGKALRVAPSGQGWQRFWLKMEGDVFATQNWFAPRLAMFQISVVNDGGAVDLTQVRLDAGDGQEMIRNANFSEGLARWFPAAQYYFVPWHPDSMYLDLLVERGLLGLVSGLGLFALGLVRAARLARADFAMAACLVGSLTALMLTGLVSSALDVPRVALLMYLLCWFSIELGRPAVATPDPLTQT